jgi:Uma2 family endonuclease
LPQLGVGVFDHDCVAVQVGADIIGEAGYVIMDELKVASDVVCQVSQVFWGGCKPFCLTPLGDPPTIGGSGGRAMNAGITEILSETPAWRKRRYDEMWERVLHTAPAPKRSHQDLRVDMYIWLRSHWARPRGNRVHVEVNLAPLGGWPTNYSIPDLVLLAPDCFDIDHDVYFEGAPTVVVEIRSPGDETMEKLPFYAQLGVPEVWAVDCDAKTPEVYVLRSGRYENQSPTADGWLVSAATCVQLRGEPENRLAMQIAGDQSTRRLLPEI